jgi:hydrogenase maturation factor
VLMMFSYRLVRLIESHADELASGLEERHDGAVLSINGSRLAFSTDSFVVRPLIFHGGNIGDLAVNGTVNDLAMTGRTVSFYDYAGPFFLWWFFPLGIWFVQPRINRLFANSIPVLSS